MLHSVSSSSEGCESEPRWPTTSATLMYHTWVCSACVRVGVLLHLKDACTSPLPPPLRQSAKVQF